MASIDMQVRNPMSAASESNNFGSGTVKVKLEWSNISYAVPIGEKEIHEMKTILHPISGSAKPGELFAIMRTSGAGKVIHCTVGVLQLLVFFFRVHCWIFLQAD